MNCATDVGERLNSIIDYFISAEIMYVISISHTSNLTHFQSHIIQISHTSNLTLFQSHTLPISHSSNLTLFQSHTLSGLHYSNLTLNYGFGKKKIVNYFPHTLLHLLDMHTWSCALLNGLREYSLNCILIGRGSAPSAT